MSVGATEDSEEFEAQTISFRADADLVAQIVQEQNTARYDIGKSEVVRTALREHFRGR